MSRILRFIFSFNIFFANLFLLKADWISDQMTSLYKNEQLHEKDIRCWGSELISGCTLKEIKESYNKEIKKPECLLFGYILLQYTDQNNKNTILLLDFIDANKYLRKNNIKKTLPWDELFNKIWEKLSYYDKKEALAQKYFYNEHEYFCEEDPQAPEQMKKDKPTFEKILSHVDNACNIDSINSTETFDQAYTSLSESMSSESSSEK